jgi:OmpA-OmpF porin, OOP family
MFQNKSSFWRKFPFIATGLCLLCFALPAYAYDKKDTTHLSDGRLLKLGKYDVKNGLFHDAEFYYQVYYQRHPARVDIAWKLGELYRATNDFDQSLKYYIIVSNLNKAKNLPVAVWYDFIGLSKNTSKFRKYPLSDFYLALMYKRTGKYKLSNIVFSDFISDYSEKDSVYFRRLAGNEIAGNNLALSLLAQPPKIILSPLTEYFSNYSYYIATAPHLFEDSTILFDAARLYFTGRYALPVTEIRYGKPEKGTWKDGGTVYGSINNNRFLTLGGCFSQDHKRYYFTRCEIRYNNFAAPFSAYSLYFEKLGIYVCSYDKGIWGEPKRLDNNINMPGTTNMMPAVGMDEQHRDVLYFVSNRPGGFGGFDIWRSTFAKGRNGFDDPVNLGRQINTVENEITPFYDQDSATLYFSSDGLPGLGGLDIFRSAKIQGGWAVPKNLGLPFNSAYDDKYFIINKDHSFGMLTKSTYCRGDQICVAQYIKLPFFSCDSIWTFKHPLPLVRALIRVIKDAGNDTSSGIHASIDVFGVNKTSGQEEKIKNFIQNNGAGVLMPLHIKNTYHIHVSKEGFYPADTTINTDTITVSQTLNYIFRLKEIPKDTPILIRNIIFDYDDSTLNNKSKLVIDSTILRYLRKRPFAKVMIISHTDSIGTDAYNMNLSLARARSIVSYLVTKGISPTRLLAKGYGFRHPVAPNRKKDGTDNPEGRALNRRSEFRVIGKVK